jgi:hypothetical protein
MNNKSKSKLLEKKLFNDIELKINNSRIQSQLFFGGMKKDIFVDLSSSYRTGRMGDKLPLDYLGFYVKDNGFPVKINLNSDKIYEIEGGKIIVEK